MGKERSQKSEVRSQNGTGFKPEIMFSLCLRVFVRDMALMVLLKAVQNVFIAAPSAPDGLGQLVQNVV